MQYNFLCITSITIFLSILYFIIFLRFPFWRTIALSKKIHRLSDSILFPLIKRMLSDNIRFIALDFETTGLDIHNDVPIQIGLLEFDNTWNIIGWFQSLIHPKKEVKELRSVVWFITWLSVEKLENAPECEDLLSQLSPFFWPNTVIIWHNVAFDLEFLKKFFPTLQWKLSIDTFQLSNLSTF